MRTMRYWGYKHKTRRAFVNREAGTGTVANKDVDSGRFEVRVWRLLMICAFVVFI